MNSTHWLAASGQPMLTRKEYRTLLVNGTAGENCSAAKRRKRRKSLIIELKAAKALADEHVAQMLGYLHASRIEHGLLINFGAAEFEIKKYALSQSREASGSSSPMG